MLRKITEVWPDLIRGWSQNPDEDNSRASSDEHASNEDAESD